MLASCFLSTIAQIARRILHTCNPYVRTNDGVIHQVPPSHRIGSFALPTFILTINLGRSPPDLSTRTSPFFPLALADELLGSVLGLLNGLSLSPFCSFRFLLPSLAKRARRLGARRSLTILLLFCFLGVDAVGTVGRDGGATLGRGDGAALGRGDGTALGRGEGAAFGRGEGAALGRGDGAAEPFAVFVLILSFGIGRGMGDGIAGGVAIEAGILIGRGAGRAGTGFATTAGTLGRGTGVGAVGAGVATFLGGCIDGCCIRGTSGVDARESGSLFTIGDGTGEGLVETGAGDGEWCTVGENTID